MKRLWAEAMLDRYRKVPGDVEWESDPLPSRLQPAQANQLGETIVRYALEAQRKTGT
jgi:hypothetical protein